MESRAIWLVRHGQASFGKSDYDNLSEQGHEQAFVLGRDLAARGITPDLLVSGSMKRHRQTLAEIAAGAGWQLTDDDVPPRADAMKASPPLSPPDDDISAGHARPIVPRRLDECWNELDHRAMLTAYKPAYKNVLVLKADMVRARCARMPRSRTRSRRPSTAGAAASTTTTTRRASPSSVPAPRPR